MKQKNKQSIENLGKLQTQGTLQEVEKLKSKVLDLQYRSMKNKLVFSGLCHIQYENCENKLRAFIQQELEIDHYIEFGNVHRFGKRNTNDACSIVARFIYYSDLKLVLQNAYKLKCPPFGISELFPAEIVERRKKSLAKNERSKTTTSGCCTNT